MGKTANTTNNSIAQMQRKRGMMGYPSMPVADPLEAWRNALKNRHIGSRTLYIHIPFCKTRCSFCPFYFGKASSAQREAYLQLLIKELEDNAKLDGIYGIPINAVFLGGGTPTDLSPAQFKRLLSVINRYYTLTNDCEITVEGRITGFNYEKMQACIDHGVNRFSIGVQTFDSDLRQSIGRIANQQQIIKTLTQLLSFNQASVVIDLLYGIPGQTMEQWIADQYIVLDEIPISGLDHYQLGIMPSMAIMQDIASGKLPAQPNSTECYALYKAGEDLMTAAGAIRLSIKHYALSYRERNANNDIAGAKNICLPFGLGASGRIGNYLFSQERDIISYTAKVKRGVKPLFQAGMMLPEYPICSKLAAQISRNRGINIKKAVEKGSEIEQTAILKAVVPLLNQWKQAKLLIPTVHCDWLKMSSLAMFNHKQLATELMDCVATAYNP